MNKFYLSGVVAMLALVGGSCAKKSSESADASSADSIARIKPVLVTDKVNFDSDDPAIWINPEDPAASLIIGTDKGGDEGKGGLFVFNLQGKLIPEKCVSGIQRPNNVDIAYGLQVGGARVDIAVCTERNTNSIRVFELPSMKSIDGGGIPVFEGDSLRAPMGIALYKLPDGRITAVVSRKNGPDGSYLWQYLLEADAKGVVKGKVLRKFGRYSGKHEIESVAVDNSLGFIYYSDEGYGVRKYQAHPDSSGRELAVLGTTGFADNHEGISIYQTSDSTGYVLVSDQQANQFQVFRREGNEQPLLAVLKVSTVESDGSDVTATSLPGFPKGFFVAMSDDATFQIYRWEDLEAAILKGNR